MVPVRSGCAMLPAQARPRVLLVEDDWCSHQALRKILKLQGCEVISAMTLSDGLGLIGVSGLDCVILDLRLPDGEGESILQKIRAEQIGVRVAVTTAEADLERLRRVAELRPEIVLSKPIELAKLLAWLRPPGMVTPAPAPRLVEISC
jgi:DNA-binding response OmpR family regulator